MHHGGGHGLHSAFDEDEVLGKVYDSKVIARLPKYMAMVKSWLALGAIGMVIGSLAQLALPYLIALATDRFILEGNLNGLNIIAILCIGAALLVWIGEYIETRFLSYAGQSVLFRMRTEMFTHLHRLSMSFFDHHLVGKLMSRVQNDVSQLQDLVTNEIISIIASVLRLAGIAIIMITMNARLALLTLIVVPVLGILIVLWQKYARRAFIKVRQAISVVNAQLQEGISAVRVTQSLSQERKSFEQFDNVNQAHLGANIDAVRMQALMAPVVQILSGIAFGLVLVVGGQQVLEGQMGPGVLIGFLLYIQQFFRPVFELIMMYAELQRAMASGVRIFELLDVEPEIKDSPNAIELPTLRGEVIFNHLSFAYEPDVKVLHDVNLTVNPGETVAIVGRTGAGKSSMMNLIARFYEVTEGEITIDGHNVTSVTQQSLRRQMGIVPQDAFLFSGNIEDNIKYGRPEASHHEVIEAAKMAGIHDFITHLEDGYDTPVGERGSNISAGQRQLICLARAILTNPRILILDEATSNVDTNTERIMQEALRQLSRGRTCIIIAHRLSTVTDADRIIVLEKGRVTEMGSHQELLAKQGLYYNMLQTLNALDSG
ncbi:ABC transporter ATP-binding protein [Chloroflexota bacterium]